MTKRFVKLTAFLCLALVLCFFAKDAKAETARVAYVNSEKYPVVCFDQSTSGTYVLKDGTNEVASGSISGSKLTVKYALAAEKKYELVLTVDDSDSSIPFKAGAKVTQTVSAGTNTITSKVTKTTGVNGVVLGVYKADTACKSTYSATETSLSVAMGKAKAGSYTVVAIATSADETDSIIYGYGTEKTFSYFPTVSSFKATGQIKKAKLTWTKIYADGVRVKYKVAGGSYKTKDVAATNGAISTTTIKSLTAGKYYYFKIAPYYKNGSSKVVGKTYSAEKKVKIYSDPGKVTGVKFDVDNHGKLLVKWSKVKAATSYKVYYKTGSGSYKLVGSRKGTKCSLEDLPKKSKCTVIVYACKNDDRSSKHSDAKSITPKTWLNNNRLRILAKRVKGIRYKKGKCIINTKISYTDEMIEAYCNYFTSHNSSTGYVVWISLYTQQGAIMKGRKGHWKIYKDLNMPGCVDGRFDCSGGSYENRTRRGLNKIFLRERSWVHPSTTSHWISHFWNKCSIHSFPCWNKKIPKGKTHPPYQDARLRQPVSNACVRVSYELAKWIYYNIPMGSQVRCK